jgi:uncharacterized membrane protein YoaK (UPF0700 family)
MTLFIASWLPHSFPDIIFVPVIALAAAYQVASFRTVDNYSYNSTFITSNLRTAVEGLYESLDPIKRSDGLRKFREFSLIIASFLAGAITGAVLASRFGNHTLWFIDVPLFAVLLVVLQRDRETRTES